MTTDNIVLKIRKLLALAADASASAGEAENAARMATRLMLKHQIDESALDASGAVAIKCGHAYARHMHEAQGFTNVPKFAQFIAVGVAHFMGTVATLVNRIDVPTGTSTQAVKFSGEIGDVKFAVWLCETLTINCMREYAASNTKDGKAAWQNGWANAVQRRLKQMADVRKNEEAIIGASDSKALIVLDKKVAVVEEKYGKANYRTNTGTAFSSEGYNKGMTTVIPTGAIGSNAKHAQLN